MKNYTLLATRPNNITLRILLLMMPFLFWQCNDTDDPTIGSGDAPEVILTSPVNGEINVSLDQGLTATFNGPMELSTISNTTFTLRQGANEIKGVTGYSGNTASFTAASYLLPSSLYTATITTGARNIRGISMRKAYTWSFTTGTAVSANGPKVILATPANGTNDVVLNTKVSVVFNTAMQPSTVSASTFMLKQGDNTIAGTVSYNGTTGTFSPAANLLPNMLYTATVTNGVKDVSGNAMPADYAWNFTTGTILDSSTPAITAVNPLANAIDVPLNKTLSVAFSEMMDPQSINPATFMLKQNGAAVAGSISFTGTTAYYSPSGNLEPNTQYTATVTNMVTDLSGNAIADTYIWNFTTGTVAGQASINLGSSGGFAVLGGSGVTNTGPTVITGDLGTSPTGTVIGFPPGIIVGSMHAADPAAAQAKLDLTTAFNDAQSRIINAISLPGDLSGLTFAPGLYANSTSTMISTGNLTLDAQGDINAIFIFKMGSTLTTMPGTKVILSGGAQAKNVYWSVGTSGTLGTNSQFSGTIMADQSISLNTGAVLNGRALTRIGAVTLQSNVITRP